MKVLKFIADWIDWKFYACGHKIGLLLIFAPTISDVARLGYKNFFEWRVEQGGIICMLIGGIFLWVHNKQEKRWDRITKPQGRTKP